MGPITGGRAMVNVFDGTRTLYTDSAPLLITVTDGNQNVVSRDFHKSASTQFSDLPVFHNFGDDYTFLAFATGFQQAGIMPVPIASNVNRIVSLMLLPEKNEINFATARWGDLKKAKPVTQALLARGVAAGDSAAQRYNDLKDRQDGEILACLLNITTALEQVHLPQKTAIEYLQQVMFDDQGDTAMKGDRFYCWADVAIIEQLKQGVQHEAFAPASPALHAGATLSFKQIQFGEANVQFTFHEGVRKTLDGVDCVKLELDIDYFKDLGAHLILEVVVNAFGSVTDPRVVYQLRWNAGQRAGIAEFDPLYTIVKA